MRLVVLLPLLALLAGCCSYQRTATYESIPAEVLLAQAGHPPPAPAGLFDGNALDDLAAVLSAVIAVAPTPLSLLVGGASAAAIAGMDAAVEYRGKAVIRKTCHVRFTILRRSGTNTALRTVAAALHPVGPDPAPTHTLTITSSDPPD